MGFKISKLLLLIILIFLQSCSGGRIGNFFETSFKNIEESKIKESPKKNMNNNEVNKLKEQIKKNKNIEKSKIKESPTTIIKKNEVNKFREQIKKNKNIEESKIKESPKTNIKKNEVNKFREQIKKNKKISSKKGKYQPQSYKIIFILKDVDPKDPIEELSTILRNSDINFEIEKIERFFDSKNKITNKN